MFFTELGNCLFASYEKNQKDANSAGYDLPNFEELGEKIGKRMGTTCLSFYEILWDKMNDPDDTEFKELVQEEIENNHSDDKRTYRYSFNSLEARIVIKGEMTYIHFKDDFGIEQRLLWLEPFTGDELFINDFNKR